MQLFSNDLGVDLGTSNVLIYADGKGLVVREPSVVAVDRNTGKILQVGSAARNMPNRTPGHVVAMRPLKDGIIYRLSLYPQAPCGHQRAQRRDGN